MPADHEHLRQYLPLQEPVFYRRAYCPEGPARLFEETIFYWYLLRTTVGNDNPARLLSILQSMELTDFFNFAPGCFF